LSLNYPSFKASAGCLPGSFSSRMVASIHSMQSTELAAGRLSIFHHKRPMASKFA